MTTLRSNCLYITNDGTWLTDDHPKLSSPKVGEVLVHKVQKTFYDVRFYYANLIDYLRILMTILALILIVNQDTNPNSFTNYSIAFLIFGSVLLDWVDGSVARHFKQTSVMGCGWDWLADLLTQYCLAVWGMSNSNNYAFKLYTVLFTCVEISTGLFDFAISQYFLL